MFATTVPARAAVIVIASVSTPIGSAAAVAPMLLLLPL